MTECSELRFAFATESRREVVAEFNGRAISSDGGALLLRETDRRMKLLNRFGQCFLDGRNPALIEHPIEHLVAQRVYGLALGYEDLNDHEELRDDPLLRVLVGKAEPGQEALAGKSTLNRMELGRMFTSVTDLPLGGKRCILNGFAAFGEFFPRDYASLGVRQQFGQVDMECLQ